MPYESGLRKWDRGSKNELPLLVKCCCYKALKECVIEIWRLWSADDRTHARAGPHLLFLIVLVEELGDGDKPVSDRRLGHIAGECLLYDHGSDADALRLCLCLG